MVFSKAQSNTHGTQNNLVALFFFLSHVISYVTDSISEMNYIYWFYIVHFYLFCNVHAYTGSLLWLPLASVCVNVTTWYQSLGSPSCIEPRIVTLRRVNNTPSQYSHCMSVVIACLIMFCSRKP